MSRLLPLGLAFALALLPLAGCLQDDDKDGEEPRDDGVPAHEVADPALADEGHDHRVAEQHAFWTRSMEQLGFDPLGPEGRPIGAYGEVDVRAGHAYVAVLGDVGETPGFVIVNVSDPADPELLSFTPSENTRITDIKATQDGNTVFLGVQGSVSPCVDAPIPPPVPPQVDPTCTPETLQERVVEWGVRVYDATDRAAPRFVTAGESPDQAGCHMISHRVIGGTAYVFCIADTVQVFRWEPQNEALVAVAQYSAQGPEGALEVLVPGPGNENEVLFDSSVGWSPHDMTVQSDPFDGREVMTVSYWNFGVRFVDVSNPVAPVELGAWAGEGASNYEGNVHTAMVTQVGDRRVAVAIPELLREDGRGMVWVLDVSDYAAPRFLGEWQAPGDHPSEVFRFSSHNFQLVQGRIYLAHYHLGVWVLDISNESSLANPVALGYYLPHENVTTLDNSSAVSVPDVWDVNVVDGVIYATDINTGLYVLHYRPDEVGNETLSGFA